MAKYRVPSSGGGTFSDNLVGNQFTDGSSIMTLGTFTFDNVTPERDVKSFTTEPYSDFLTLDDVGDDTQSVTENATNTRRNTVRFNTNKSSADKSLFGSLVERVGVSISNIIQTFPAGFMVDSDSPYGVNGYTAESITYNEFQNVTEFTVQYVMLYNPLEVKMKKPNTFDVGNVTVRDFYANYQMYVVVVDGVEYDVIGYSEPNSANQIKIRVNGNCFNGMSNYSESYVVRPNSVSVETFYDGLDDLESTLLNRESNPIFNAGFTVPKEIDNGRRTEMITEYVNWPISKDGWNIQIVGLGFDQYVFRVRKLAELSDNYKSNLIVRFLTSPQLMEFDTDDKKMSSILQIYGQSFDSVKRFIDNVANMRRVSYDGINNVPDILLKNLSETLGFSSVNLFNEKKLKDSLYLRQNPPYDNQVTGLNLVETEYEIYRRILTNLTYLYKTKGTRNSIEFFLKFIGAPEPMIKLDEFVYQVTSLPSSNTIEDDISDVIQGTRVKRIAEFVENDTYMGYTLTVISGSTEFSRDEYPVYEDTFLPRGINTEDVFFQKGSGWYKKTLYHRSSDIIDKERSDLSGRIKIIKTKSKPFTYGEEYFDVYRTLPGLDYGFGLKSVVDNQKSRLVNDDSDVIMNRKNIHIFISGGMAIDYDIYSKSRNNLITFGDLTPQTGVTFAEYMGSVLNEVITNSHVCRYKKNYPNLVSVYSDYQQNVGFTPYHYVSVNEFVNSLGPYWVKIVEQFVPSTTLWMGGNLIENGLFNRSKFHHKMPSVPFTFEESTYPTFKTVLYEDVNNISGGGTMDDFSTLRSVDSTQVFSGVSYTIFIKVNDTTYSKTTETYDLFLESDQIGMFDLESNGNDGYRIPDDEKIKIGWRETLDRLIDEINTSNKNFKIKPKYTINTNGDDNVKFTVYYDGYVGERGITLGYYFLPSYFMATLQQKSLEHHYGVDSLSTVYLVTGDTIPRTNGDLNKLLNSGQVRPVMASEVNSGDKVLTVRLKPYNEVSEAEFKKTDSVGSMFIYDVFTVEKTTKFNVSGKKHLINNTFGVCPTSKVLTYRKETNSTGKNIHHFQYKLPADIVVSLDGVGGDFILNQFGDKIEVYDVSLNVRGEIDYIGIYGGDGVDEWTVFNSSMKGVDDHIIIKYGY